MTAPISAGRRLTAVTRGCRLNPSQRIIIVIGNMSERTGNGLRRILLRVNEAVGQNWIGSTLGLHILEISAYYISKTTKIKIYSIKTFPDGLSADVNIIDWDGLRKILRGKHFNLRNDKQQTYVKKIVLISDVNIMLLEWDSGIGWDGTDM